MKQGWRVGVGVFALLLVMSGECLGQGKDKKKPGPNEADKATPEEYKQIAKAKELEGKVGAVDAGVGSLNFQLDFPQMAPNPNFKPGQPNSQQKLYQQQVQIMSNPNPAVRQQKMMQLVAQYQKQQQLAASGKGGNNNDPYKVVHHYKDFDLQLGEKVIVRKLNLGVEYDGEGNVIQRTKEDIAKLRGNDPKVPGYAAKVEDLKPGQVVHLYLNALKTDKNDAKEEGVGNVVRPSIRMIVILQDANTSTGATKEPKKKN